MKLMLQEASSVIKATQKAWENSGRPQEFSIKILEFGEKNFWGTVKRPAVISISYDPKKQTENEQEKLGYKGFKKETVQPRREMPAKQQPGQGLKNKLQPKEQFVAWEKEYINDISLWLGDMLKMMGMNTNFEIKPEQKMLKVFLDKRVLKEEDAEKMFFIGLSHLLMQSLKKKHKKKFKNYYLIIHSKSSKFDGAK